MFTIAEGHRAGFGPIMQCFFCAGEFFKNYWEIGWTFQ